MTDNPGRPKIESQFDTTKRTGADKWAQKRRLAGAMRRVIERLVPSDAPEDELRTAADALERYAEQLKAHSRLKRMSGHAESANAGDVGAFFDQSPLLGLANPLAPPITIGVTGEKTAGATVTFGSAYEGPPGSVHGGFVAAAFDEVLGFVQSLSGRGGFTGTLTIKYRKPTPLHTELHFDAEMTGVEGRKIYAAGQLYAGDMLCAEAEGVFITVEEDRWEELEKKRAEIEKTL